MADNLPITPGSGAVLAADDVSGVLFQRIKIDLGGDGISVAAPGDGTYGLDVDVTRVSGDVSVKPKAGEVFPVNDNGGSVTVDDGGVSLTVDAPATAPVAVRLSDGSAFIAGLPVSGTVTANQGTAVSPSGAWPIKLTDGVSIVDIEDVGGAKALKVSVVESVEAGGNTDGGTFTEGTSGVSVAAGEYNDSAADAGSGKAAAIRITQKRALHVNLRSGASEVGTSGSPIRVDPTGSTKQPVKLSDDQGNAYSDSNPLKVQHAPRTRVTAEVAITESQTGIVVWTPTTSKKFVITHVVLSITVAGNLSLFDATDADGNRVCNGNQATGNRVLDFAGNPWRSATANNVLKYTTGASITGTMQVHGYEE